MVFYNFRVFFIFLFLIIFYKIFRLLSFNRIQSIALSLVLFTIPDFLHLLSLERLNYFSVVYFELFSLRFPRPLVSNIYFFSFFLFLIKLSRKKIFVKKNFIILGLISGLSFTSFIHIFIVEQISLLFFFIYKYKLQVIKVIKENTDCIISYILTFIIISAPFLINTFFNEPDLLERFGLANLDYDQRIFLFKYHLAKLLKPEFFGVFISSILLIIFLNSKNLFNNTKKLDIFYIIFYSSIITPFVFILISTKYFSHFYHFNNIIVICAFLLLFFSISVILNMYMKKIFSEKFTNFIFIFLVVVSLTTNVIQAQKNYFKNHLNDKSILERKEFNKIINIIQETDLLKKNKDLSLLTFDNKFLIWFILNNVKFLKIANGVIVPRKNEMIENDLINTFKFLNLSIKDFELFLENKKKSSWRYRNENVKDLFWLRYQANSLITFNKSKNFNKEILDFVNKSSPLLVQQLLIPNEELQRLLKKFTLKSESIYSDPGIIIINKKNPILNKSKINYDLYCKKFEGEFYDFYYNLNLNSNCDS